MNINFSSEFGSILNNTIASRGAACCTGFPDQVFNTDTRSILDPLLHFGNALIGKSGINADLPEYPVFFRFKYLPLFIIIWYFVNSAYIIVDHFFDSKAVHIYQHLLVLLHATHESVIMLTPDA